MAKVSIVMNCFNSAQYLKEAIDSIYAQTEKDWEIIFVDNASTDHSAAIAQAYDEKLKYYKLPETIPLYAARNYALEHINSPFIAFLDADDAWMPDKLSNQLGIMEQQSGVYLVCSAYIRKNEKSGSTSRQIAFRSNLLTLSQALDRYPIVLSAVLLRCDAQSAKKIRFEPTLNLTGDYELFIKLIYAYQAYYIAEPLVTWRAHATNMSAKLIHDWPKELAETHGRWEKQIKFNTYERSLVEKRYLRALSLVHLAAGNYKTTRQVTKKYFLRDIKLSLIYLSTLHRKLAQRLLKLRGL